MVHLHEVRDTDSHYVIDPITRSITNANSAKNTLMQGDHNSEIYTFEIPRFVEGHDMTLCNAIRIHYNDISADKANESKDFYPVEDMHIDEVSTDTLVFSWLVSGNATMYAGLLSFRIQFLCINDSGNITYKWHTDIFKGITISDGFDNSEAAVEEYADQIAAWEAQLFGAGDSVMADIENKASEQKAAIEAKGAETLATIPDDYTELYGMARDAVRTRANAIVENVEGDVISANDCSGDYLRGLKVFGKSEQIKTTGAQLVDFSVGTTATGVTATFENDALTVVGDGSLPYQSWSKDITALITEHPGEILSFNYGELVLAENHDGSIVQLNIANTDGTNTYYQLVSISGYKKTYSVPADTSGIKSVHLAVYSTNNGTAKANTVTIKKPIFHYGLEVKEYEPYSGRVASPSPEWAQEISSVENPGISIFGKNLAYFGHILPKTSNGVTFSLQEDGSIIAHGTPTVSGEEVIDTIHAQSITRPTLVNGQTYESDSTIQIEHNDGSMTYNRIVTITDDIKSINSYLQPRAEYYTNGQVFRMKLWLVGNEMQEFEAAKPVQTVTIPRTLHGIPVSSGGNYTDANGQRWICDEVDLARGVYVQRVGTQIFNNAFEFVNVSSVDGSGVFYCGLAGYDTASYALTMMSDQFRFAGYNTHNSEAVGHLSSGEFSYIRNTTAGARIYFAVAGVTTKEEATAWLAAHLPTVYFPLKTPVETALTDEEIFNFSQLHSNYPNTTVLNDAGAWVKVAYNADTQLYFDNSRGASDEQVQNSVDAWLTAHYSDAEGVSF